MAGGMTHIDTLDPKPENKEVMGDTTAINTSADGIQVGHWLPRTAQQMHLATVVRSLNTNQGAHAQANYLLHTSYQRRGTIVHPTMGAWVSRFTEKLNSTLPANVRINGGSDVLGAGYFEKKHGPLALIEEGLPVVILAPKDRYFEKTISNMQEVIARGGKILLITNNNDSVISENVRFTINLPSIEKSLSPFLSTIPLQLLAYHVALLKKCDIDKPRNLAKSVTVE